MSALNRLTSLLSRSVGLADNPPPPDNSIDAVIAQLERQTRGKPSSVPPEDIQRQAIDQFWKSQKFESFKDARSVSFGLCISSGVAGLCLMDDRQRFLAVLDSLKEWINAPRWYRRCYQGLVRSYFAYDPKNDSVSAIGRENWITLRNYLRDHVRHIVDKTGNPDWVETVIDNQQLFGKDPCRPYAEAVLKGDNSTIDHLCLHLGELKASWFMRALVLAQVRQATEFSDERFKALVPQLMALLGKNPILRDQGLILVLDRYASAAQPVLNQSLSDAAVESWGNPWLPSNETRWGGVVPAARQMVSDWLKREFIEAFFTKLAADGVGDRRRANFWLRYVKSMDIRFALGTTTLYSKDKDFVVLRQKMKGLYTELKATGSKNNAFVMTMGNLVAVEFGSAGNALYGYDRSLNLPFDLYRPVFPTKYEENSLRHDEPTRILWMQHKDGIHGYEHWEDMFEATLKQRFGITPNAVSQQTPTPMPTQLSFESTLEVQPLKSSRLGTFSMAALNSLAREKNLIVDDLSTKNGNLWVRTDNADPYVNRMLMAWEFHYRHGKGWWR